MSNKEEDRVLTAQRVSGIVRACLFTSNDLRVDDEGKAVPVREPILAEGVVKRFGFDPNHVAAHKEAIRTLLNELPDEFHVGKGGGYSFRHACMDKQGTQWAEHCNIDELLCLGIAAGFVVFPIPRDLWCALPGGVPYLTVNTTV